MYISTLTTQAYENVLQPTREPWLRFGRKVPPFFFFVTHSIPDASERMAPGPDRYRDLPALAQITLRHSGGLPLPHDKHRAAAHFESCESEETTWAAC